MKTKQNTTVESEYEKACMNAQDMLNKIQELIFDHPAPGMDEFPIDWSHVGTVNAVNTQLKEILSMLGGND